MARRRGNTLSRSEITEKVDKHEDDMEVKGEEIEKTVEDVDTERETIDGLELAGTTEGTEGVEQSIEAAQERSTQEFDSESAELEDIQHESEEQEEDLQERSDTTSSDLGKISKATGEIHSDSANNELIAAKESAVHDIEFLDDEAKRSQDAREQSRRLHEEREARVNAGRRS